MIIKKLIKINFLWPAFLALTSFSLLWQTKLIIRPAPINYWEISLFLPMVFLIALAIVAYPDWIKNFSQKNIFKRILISLALWEIFIFISLFISPDFYLSLFRYSIFLLAAILFLILRRLSWSDKKWALIGFLSGVLGQAIIGIIQFFSQKSVAIKYLGLAQQEAIILGTAVVEAESGRWLRAYGALDHPNILGGLTVVACLIAAWHLLFIKKSSLKLNIFFWLVYLVSLGALFFSFSRSAWIAYLLGQIILIILLIKDRVSWRSVIIFFCATGFLLGPLVYSFNDLVATRLLAQGRLENISLQEREMSVNEFTIKSWPQFLFGQGFGASTLWRFNQDVGDDKELPAWEYQPIHNAGLLLLLEIGLLGFLAAVTFILFIFVALKNSLRPFNYLGILLLSTLVVLSLFDHWLVSLPIGWWLLFWTLGIVNFNDKNFLLKNNASWAKL